MALSSPILRLCRPANALTAAADVVAGWCIAGADDWAALALLAPASMLLYAGGITLNDVFDARVDAVERPERPIPSGAISRRAAAMLGAMLLALGGALAVMASLIIDTATWSGAIAGALIALILLYDSILKKNALTRALGMGGCRGLNLALGMSASGVALAVWWPLATIHFAYIGAVTLMSQTENAGQSARSGPAIGILGAAAAVIAYLAVGFASVRVDGLLIAMFLAAFTLVTLPSMIQAARTPQSKFVRGAVMAGVLGIVALDASIAAGFAGVVYGLGTLALLPLCMWLGARFAVT